MRAALSLEKAAESAERQDERLAAHYLGRAEQLGGSVKILRSSALRSGPKKRSVCDQNHLLIAHATGPHDWRERSETTAQACEGRHSRTLPPISQDPQPEFKEEIKHPGEFGCWGAGPEKSISKQSELQHSTPATYNIMQTYTDLLPFRANRVPIAPPWVGNLHLWAVVAVEFQQMDAKPTEHTVVECNGLKSATLNST